MTESTKIDYVSIVQDLRDEADLCRNETATDIADLLDDAASCIVAMKSQFFALRADLAAAQEALAELHRGKVLADGMANTVRGFILKRAERETLDEVAAEYRRWEEDYCHRNFRKPKP